MKLGYRFASVLRKSWAASRPRLRVGMPYGAVLIGFGAVALVWIGVFQYLRVEQAQAEKAALQNASNLARVFEEHIVRALKAVDQTLLYVRDSYAKDPDHFDMSQWSHASPLLADFLTQISIDDKEGNRLQSNFADAGPATVGDRDYFKFQANATQDELFINQPIIGRTTRRWSIPMSRRITAPDGSFAGIVDASLDPYYLTHFYESVDVGAKGAVALVGTDGIVRARVALRDTTVGQSLLGSPLMQNFAERPIGTFRSGAVIDGVVRLFSYRAVAGFPLIIEVGFSVDEILAAYYRDRTTCFALATLLSVLVFAVTALVTKRQVRLQQMRDALTTSEAKYRTVVDNLNEVVFQTDADGRWSFLNPAWTAITGLSIDESLGRLSASYVDPRDRSLYAALFRPVLGDAPKNQRRDLRFLGKQGVVRWLAVDTRIVHDSAGRTISISGTLNDITERKQIELELRQSRTYLTRAQRMANIGSFDHNLIANKIHWSDELHRVYGLPAAAGEEGIAAVLPIVHPDDRDKFLAARDDVLSGRPSPAMDFRIIRPDGVERILHRAYDVTIDRSGKPIHLFGTIQDITERKESEIELRQSRANLARAQRFAHIGSFDHDLITDEVRWSDELARIYGLEGKEGQENIDAVIPLVHPDDLDKFLNLRDDALSGCPSLASDFRLIRPDGVERVLHRECEVTFDGTGRPIHLFGTTQDITERTQIERELHQSRANLARAQQLAHVGSFDHDPIAGKTYWSDELYRLYGLTAGKDQGGVVSVIPLVHPADLKEFMASWDDVSKGCPSAAMDFRIIRPDGIERILHREHDGTFDETGKQIRLFGTVQDITERKQAEEALREARDAADRAARAKSDFLATMSHEIRSPMNAIVGIIEQLQETSLGIDQKQMIEMIHDSAAALGCILNDILDFSKIEAGAITVAPEAIELSRFIHSVCETLANGASQKGLGFEIDVATDLPKRVSVDPGRLRQILVNLLSNAVKFTAAGVIRLTASSAEESGGAMLRIAVSDSGIGMSPEVIARLFTPFTQADASTTRDFGGTGLGLSISRHLAELLGGSLGVTSQPGIGSVFTLLLPLVAAEQSLAPAPDLVVEADYPRFDDLHVLVAEDLATNRWLLQRQLERMGFVVKAVENGRAAVAALAAERYDLLITDFHMPKMDGVALARHIRESEAPAGGVHLPILGLTADVTGNSRERCMAAGMDAVVSKPTDMRNLGTALQSLLSRTQDVEPVAEAPRSDAVFDDSTYRELFSTAPAEGKEWLTDFMQGAEGMLTELRAHAEAGDRTALAETAHKLAGSSLVAGAMRLGEYCRSIQQFAPTADADLLLGAPAAAEAAYAAARIEIMHRIN